MEGHKTCYSLLYVLQDSKNFINAADHGVGHTVLYSVVLGTSSEVAHDP